MSNKKNKLTPEQKNQIKLSVIDLFFDLATEKGQVQRSINALIRGYLRGLAEEQECFNQEHLDVLDDAHAAIALLDFLQNPTRDHSPSDVFGVFNDVTTNLKNGSYEKE